MAITQLVNFPAQANPQRKVALPELVSFQNKRQLAPRLNILNFQLPISRWLDERNPNTSPLPTQPHHLNQSFSPLPRCQSEQVTFSPSPTNSKFQNCRTLIKPLQQLPRLRHKTLLHHTKCLTKYPKHCDAVSRWFLRLFQVQRLWTADQGSFCASHKPALV